MPNTENRLEKRTTLLNKIKGIKSANPRMKRAQGTLFNDSNTALTELFDRINDLHEKKTSLTLEETNALLELYAKSGKLLSRRAQEEHKFLMKNYMRPEEPTENDPYAGYDTYIKMLKKMGKDYAALYRYRNALQKDREKGREERTLDIDQFFDRSRTRTVSLDGRALSEHEKVGAGMSSRYKVSIPVKDEPIPGLSQGDTFTAYFTESRTYDGKLNDSDISRREELEIMRDMTEKYPALESVFKGTKGTDHDPFYEWLTNMGNEDPLRNDLYYNTADFLTKNGPDQVLTAMSRQIMGLRAGVVDEEAKDSVLSTLREIQMENDPKVREEMITGLMEYASAILKADSAAKMKKALQINSHAAVGKRNALMSVMADVLGGGDCLSFSEKVNLKSFENGKEVKRKGVVMMPAKGVDPTHSGLDSVMAEFDPSRAEAVPGLNKKIAQLQFIDYICGNVDRHTGNYFYQFGTNGKLTGVQGIDNDMAFGGIVDLEKGLGNNVSFEDLRVIPKSMADAVRNIGVETFKFLLYGYDLSDAEIDATVKRFSNLQKNLNACEEYYANKAVGDLDPKMPRIVPDSELDLYSANEQLSTNYQHKQSNNLFGKITGLGNRKDNLLVQIGDSRKYAMKEALEYKTAFMDNRKGSLKQNVRTLDRLIAGSKEQNAAFTAMRNAVKDVLQDSEGKIRKNLVKNDTMIVGINESVDTAVFVDAPAAAKKMEPVLGKDAPLSDTIRSIQSTDIYTKLNDALEKTYEYLSSDEAVKVADQYQDLQLSLSEVPAGNKEQREELLARVNELKETEGFKKYMAAVTNRDRLSEQLERYVKIKEECDQLKAAGIRAAKMKDSEIDLSQDHQQQKNENVKENAAKKEPKKAPKKAVKKGPVK